MGLLYQRAQMNMPKLRVRNESRKRKKNVVQRGADVSITGRGEFCVLMEELFKISTMKTLFTSPLHMCVKFAEQASSLLATDGQRVAVALSMRPIASTTSAWR